MRDIFGFVIAGGFTLLLAILFIGVGSILLKFIINGDD